MLEAVYLVDSEVDCFLFFMFESTYKSTTCGQAALSRDRAFGRVTADLLSARVAQGVRWNDADPLVPEH